MRLAGVTLKYYLLHGDVLEFPCKERCQFGAVLCGSSRKPFPKSKAELRRPGDRERIGQHVQKLQMRPEVLCQQLCLARRGFGRT